MAAVTSDTHSYEKALLAASGAAEQAYREAWDGLDIYVQAHTAAGRSREWRPIYPQAIKTQEAFQERYGIFQACIRQAFECLRRNPNAAQEVFRILQIGEFYNISLHNPVASIPPSDQIDCFEDALQQAVRAVPKISEYARAQLVAVSTDHSPYVERLLAASSAAEESYKAASTVLREYPRTPYSLTVVSGVSGFCSGSSIELAHEERARLKKRYAVFQECIRQVLQYRDPTAQDQERAWQLLKIREWYRISLEKPIPQFRLPAAPTDGRNFEEAQQVVPEISEYERTQLTAIGMMQATPPLRLESNIQ
ncbi:MAG: hypothetical protein KGQ49_01125 [Verrucomicrobia bacterium]|nr:hypothetical protein [Verrucomicrobiota bacterium]MDE3047121.1 hypothetical protein [Verrucomicrobiota bacterium]